MQSDFESTEQEQATTLKILKERFALSDAEVAQLTELGHHSAKNANDLQQFTSLINRELDMAEKIRIIEYMWQVAYADNQISAHENHLMRKVASLALCCSERLHYRQIARQACRVEIRVLIAYCHQKAISITWRFCR